MVGMIPHAARSLIKIRLCIGCLHSSKGVIGICSHVVILRLTLTHLSRVQAAHQRLFHFWPGYHDKETDL